MGRCVCEEVIGRVAGRVCVRVRGRVGGRVCERVWCVW